MQAGWQTGGPLTAKKAGGPCVGSQCQAQPSPSAAPPKTLRGPNHGGSLPSSRHVDIGTLWGASVLHDSHAAPTVVFYCLKKMTNIAVLMPWYATSSVSDC